MKKVLFFIVSLILPVLTYADAVKIGGIYYNLTTSNLTAEVTRNTSDLYTGDITIPSTVKYGGKTYDVTSIGYYGFGGCSGLTSVTIPNSITNIGEYAFCNCDNLTDIQIPNSVTSLGARAFQGCDGLTSATIGHSVSSIRAETFEDCYHLRSITLGHSVSSLSEEAFSGCVDLRYVYCCRETPPLTDSYAFDAVLYNIDLFVPAGSIAAYQAAVRWKDFKSISAITVSTGEFEIGGIKYRLSGNQTAEVIAKTPLYSGNIMIPSSVNYLGADYSVTSIGEEAFKNCGPGPGSAIYIPGSVTSIGNNAFQYGGFSIANYESIESLCNINFVSLCSNPFGDELVGHLYIGGQEVTDLVIPGSVTNIGSYTFSGCCYLTSVTIPGSVQSIGTKAFQGCGMTTLTIKSGVQSIGDYAFEGCGASSVVIPNSVSSIGECAFQLCSNLTSFTFSNNMTSTGFGVLMGCTSLTSVNIPDGITTIAPSAFANTALTSVIIPSSVTNIGGGVFSGCNGLTAIRVNKPTPIPLTSSPFSNTQYQNATLYVPSGSVPSYSSANFWKEFKTISEITKTNQTVSLSSIPEKTYGDATYTLPDKTNENLTLTWTVTDTNVATVSSNVLTIRNAGTTTVTATQAGNEEYNSFSREYTLTVNKAPLTVTANNYSIKQGEALPTFAGTITGFKNSETSSVLTTQPTFSCSATSASAPGTYDINVSDADATNYSFTYVKGTLTITTADAVIVTANSYTINYGDPLPTFGYTSAGATLNGTPTISCTATSSSPVGTYPITITKGSVTNYNDTYVNGTLTINKAPLTVTAKSYTIKQGDPLPTFEATITGFKNSETSAVLSTQPTISCTATSASAPGTYDINVSDAAATNYSFTYVKGTLTITDADPVTVTANSYTITYGDPLPTYAYSSMGAPLSGTPSISCSATSTSPVGTYPITIAKGSVTNYNATYVNGTLTITKAPLTITAKSYTIKQGDPLPTFEATYSGFKNSETSSVLTTQPTFSCSATTASELGTYDITVSGASATNYSFNYVKGTLTIAAADAIIVTTNSYTITYGDPLPSYEYTSSGAALNGTPAISCNATTTSPVGTYPITITKGSITNYNVTYVNGTLTINKAPLTVTAKSYTIKQGEPLPTFEVTYSGFKNNETATVLTTKPNCTCSITSTSTPGTYDILVDGGAATNYDLSYVKGTLTITQADPVTVTANSYTITYGDMLPTYGYTSSGAVLSGTPQINCAATQTSPAGTYPITISKGTVNNYNVTYVNGTLTINKAPLTVTAKSYTIKQGDPLPTFEATYSGFKNSETSSVLTTQPTFSCSATSSSILGTYDINVSGAAAANYDIKYVKGTLTIISADAVVVTANSYTINYGDPLPDFGYTSSGVALSGTPSISCAATQTSPAGEYPIIISKGSVTNFNVSFVSGTLTIKKVPLTITAKSYTIKQGDPLPTFEVTYSGFKLNENSSVLTKLPDVTTSAPNNPQIGSYVINVSGASANNYDISYVNGTLTVEPGTYKITYMLDGTIYKTVSYNYGDVVTPEPALTKEGYTFSGWAGIPTTMPANDVTVTGTFTINKYKLTYMVDGAEYKSYEIKYGAKITPEAEPEKEGYTFSDWSEIPQTMPAEDVTVIGTFTINKYMITYIIDGEVYMTEEVKYGAEIVAPNPPVRDGYEFAWSDIPETMPANDITIYGTYIVGIEAILSVDSDVKIFTVSGKPLSKLQKGVNIIQFKNGKTKKVMVK